MRIDASHPLAARAVSASVPPRPRELPGFEECTPVAELPLEPWQPSALHPVRLELPYPPSVNRLYRSRAVGTRVFPYKTHEHRDYLAAVGAAVGVVVPWPEDVKLSLVVRLYRPRRVGDIDGPIKALFDSLNGRAWVDDSQVHRLELTLGDDKHRPRVEVEIQQFHRSTTEET